MTEKTQSTQSTVLIEEKEKKQNRMATENEQQKTKLDSKNPNEQQNPTFKPIRETHMQQQNRTTEKTQSTVLIEEKEKKQNRMVDEKRATKTQTRLQKPKRTAKSPNGQQKPKHREIERVRQSEMEISEAKREKCGSGRSGNEEERGVSLLGGKEVLQKGKKLTFLKWTTRRSSHAR
ncbi:hypothetical protein FH972_012899 [Carpinus fangiana]|uniref:Uncharacterized protein n=1 Tax=Carpinus fangiana TaxID=176857 RepID=A0A5N6R6S1_9ROSI|nr:hypothetical protein FH972_012899 [Carpinus fangiana]